MGNAGCSCARRWNVSRNLIILSVVLGLLFLVLSGQGVGANDDFSLSLRLDNGSRTYTNGSVYAYDGCGNSSYYDYGYDYGYRPGLSLRYRDGKLSADFGNRIYNGRNRHRNYNRGYVNDFSYGYGETGNSLNDRPGYRVFIPQGLQGGSQQVLPGSQYLGLPRTGNYGGHAGACYQGCGCGSHGNPYYGNPYYGNGYGGGPLVIQYGYPVYNGAGYNFPARADTLWTAPANPDYGYYGDGRYRDDVRNDQPDSVVNDNSVTNNYYYYGDGGASGASLPAAPREQPAPAKDPRSERAQAVEPAQSYSTRFRTETRLELNDSVTIIRLSDEGLLSVGPENSPPVTVSAAAEHDFGCFATWHSEHGLTLVFREGNSIMGAYRTKDGWWSEALGADVDFTQDVGISTMNGDPWLKFTDSQGQRIIMKFADGVWQTIGYGTVGN